MAWLSSPVLFSARRPKPLTLRFHWPPIHTPLRPSSSVLKNHYSVRSFRNQTRTHSRSFNMNYSLNNSADPIERTSSPYSDPRQIGPKSKILASRTYNYHSTSLRNMVTATVNKTALHPGGVQYVQRADELPLAVVQRSRFNRFTNYSRRPVKEHTELEEELHENAHIDYDRVAIVRATTYSLLANCCSLLTAVVCRSPIPALQHCTKMPLSTKPALPSHPPVLSPHIQERRRAGRL